MAADVFVSLASYDDPDTLATVRSLLADPGLRVRVGVVLQSDDAALAADLNAIPEVSLLHLRRADARGIGFARSLAQSLWEGEGWYYQTDAHMRFQDGWAKTLARQSEELPQPAIISTAPQPTSERFDASCVLSFNSWDPCGPLTAAHTKSQRWFEGSPVIGRMLSGAHLWAPGKWVQDVPFDPYLLQRTDTSLALRSWTAGYDIWHPPNIVAYHDYKASRRNHGYLKPLARLIKVAHDRMARLYGWASEPSTTLGVYGLGRVRTIAEYEAFTGVNFLSKTLVPETEWRKTL